MSSDGFEYLSGVEVKEGAALPAEFKIVQLPAREYVVFTHADHGADGGAHYRNVPITRWLPSRSA